MAADLHETRRLQTLLNEYEKLLEKSEATSSDKLRRSYTNQAHDVLSQFVLSGRTFETVTDQWGESHLKLVKTEDELLAERELMRQSYTGMYERELKHKRAEIKSRLESEIRSLQRLAEVVDAEEWDRVYSSDLRSSNRPDLIKLIEEQRLMGEMLSRLGDPRDSE